MRGRTGRRARARARSPEGQDRGLAGTYTDAFLVAKRWAEYACEARNVRFVRPMMHLPVVKVLTKNVPEPCMGFAGVEASKDAVQDSERAAGECGELAKQKVPGPQMGFHSIVIQSSD